MTHTINVMFAAGEPRGQLIAVEAVWWNSRVEWGPRDPSYRFVRFFNLPRSHPDFHIAQQFEEIWMKAWPVFHGSRIHPQVPWVFAPYEWDNERLNQEIKQLELEGKL